MLGKHTRITIYAKDKDDALEELFNSIKAKTKIHFVVELENEFNEIVHVGNELLSNLSGFSKES